MNEIFSHIDKYSILQKIFLIAFVIFYFGYTKLAFITLLADFEKLRISIKNKFLFFITSFLYTFIGSIFFFYLLLLMLGFIDFELLIDNVNLFLALNIFTALYCIRKLFMYTTMGCLSLHNIIGSMISDETKKLKYLKEADKACMSSNL